MVFPRPGRRARGGFHRARCRLALDDERDAKHHRRDPRDRQPDAARALCPAAARRDIDPACAARAGVPSRRAAPSPNCALRATMTASRDPPGGRPETVRVRKARRRKPSSTAWLSRQLNDPYVAEARRQGYRSRAAFKLIELDDRFHLLRPGIRVVDLGCAPGGWTQVAVERVRPRPGRGIVLGIDLAEVPPPCRRYDPDRRRARA